MSQSSIKLTYFPLTGRAELIRLALAAGNVTFEDERIPGDEFAKRKPTLPLGQLPVLEVDGETYSQSMALARFAAKLGGLYPSDSTSALRVDMIVDTVLDVTNAQVDIEFREKDEEAKRAKRHKLVTDLLPRSFAALEKIVGDKYAVGNSLTLADLTIFDRVHNSLKKNYADFDLAAYPKLLTIVSDVAVHPHVAAYLSKHA